MKIEGALARRFVRHDGIYRSDVSSLLFTPGASPAFRSGRCQGIGHAGKHMPCPSSAMSSGRLFLDRVARLQSPSLLHRHCQDKAIASSGQRTYHRTASCGLTGCLSLGVHRSLTRSGSCYYVSVGTSNEASSLLAIHPQASPTRWPLPWPSIRIGIEGSLCWV